MKSIWVAVLGAFVILGAGRAAAETRAGLLGGVGITTLHQGQVLITPGIHCEGFDYKPATHLVAGGVVEFGWGGKLALRLEPTYATKGSNYQDPVCYYPPPLGYVPTPGKENDLRLSYLELPILLTASADRGRLRPYLLGGPIVGHLASASELRVGQVQDVSGLLKKWAVALALGGGLRYTVGRGAAFVEGRYGLGLLSIGASGPYRPVSPQYASSYDRGPQFLAGVTFGINH